MNHDDLLHETLEIVNGKRASAPEKSMLDNPALPEGLAGPLPSVVRSVPWNKAEVLERLGEDEDLLREMCGIFLSESAILLEKLRQAVLEGNPDIIQRAAHSLKGEVSYLSAPAAMESARRLEDMGHDRDVSQAQVALARLEREMDCLYGAIREIVGAES